MASGGVATTKVPMVEPDQWLEMGGIAADGAAGHVVVGRVVVAGEDAGVVRQDQVDRAADWRWPRGCMAPPGRRGSVPSSV